jgi:rod shape-determining protein MreB and related proteins
MLSSVLGMFSQDLAVDLGTSTVRLYLSQFGTVLSRTPPGDAAPGTLCAAPTAVAVHTDRAGRRRVMAIGADVVPMMGRTPDDVDVVRPFGRGLIADAEVAEAMLLHLVRRVHGRNGWMRPRMFVAVPYGAHEDELAAVRDMCQAVGGREVRFVPRPIAAGLGAQLPIHEPSGTLLADVGAAGAEVSVLSLGAVVSCRTVDAGGDGMDRAIIDWLQAERELLVGRTTAERVKQAIGAASEADPELIAMVKGRCLRRGVPRTEAVTAADIQGALGPLLDRLAEGIRKAMEEAPPELSTDILESGVVLTGGGAVLPGLDQAMRDRTGLPVVCSDAPDQSVIHGVGRVLDDRAPMPVIA